MIRASLTALFGSLLGGLTVLLFCPWDGALSLNLLFSNYGGAAIALLTYAIWGRRQ